MTPTRHWQLVDSPLGPLLLTSDGQAVTYLFLDGPGALEALPELDSGARSGPPGEVLSRAAIQLEEYFSGRRTSFHLPLKPTGTPFQLRVWKAMEAIPFGETASYGAVARDIGRPTAVRAVGGACGRNPLPIFLPCHRVIGSDGSLTGFGGGLKRKVFLLELEAGVAGSSQTR
jgi:methylated-DNA-[protein]-cysteine S-methyltransferase